METKIEETPKSSGENKQNNGSQEKSNDLEVKKSDNEISKEQENSRKSNKLVDSDVGKQIEEKKTVDLLEVLSETLENMLNHETILGTTSAENEDDIEMELSPTDLNVVASKNPINVESQDKTIEKVLMEEMTSVPKCEDVDLDLVKKDVEDLKISEDGEEVLTHIDKVNVPDTVLDKPTPTSVIEVFDDEDIEMTSIDEKKPDTLDADILDIKDEKIIQEILDDYERESRRGIGKVEDKNVTDKVEDKSVTEIIKDDNATKGNKSIENIENANVTNKIEDANATEEIKSKNAMENIEGVNATEEIKSKNAMENIEGANASDKIQDVNSIEEIPIANNDPGLMVIDDLKQDDSTKKVQVDEEKVKNDLSNSKLDTLETDKNMNDNKKRKLTDNDFVYFRKECVNYDCDHKNNTYIRAPNFILNFYKTPRKTNKPQFVCDRCYDQAVDKYEELCGSLCNLQPILYQDIPIRQDFVEIFDSSDEDETQIKSPRKDVAEFDEETVDLLEKELDDTICKILKRVEIKNQISWTKTILKNKIKNIEEESSIISSDLNLLQKQADKMHTALYQCPKIKLKQLHPVDLNTGPTNYNDSSIDSIPSFGILDYPPIELNGVYYAVKNKAVGSWLPSRVIEFMDVVIGGHNAVKYYKIQFLGLKIPTMKCVPAKHMAYGRAPTIRLSIGTRVIALFDGTTLSLSKDKKNTSSLNAFYPGIIAEQIQAYSKYRYLIFFDDGYAQYVQHKNVRVVCEASEKVWEDVHPGSREFIHNYLSHYQKHRPMVQVRKGQNMLTESCGKWIYAKVVDIDASLVQMFFSTQNRSEWIYRGSTRLGPLFKEKQTIKKSLPPILPRRSEPYVRYIQDDEPVSMKSTTTTNTTTPTATTNINLEKRSNVAKKSTAKLDVPVQTPSVKHLNNSTIFLEDDNRPKGKVVYYTAKKNMPPKSFVPHDCSPRCLFPITHNLNSYSPLAKPLLSGWERQIFKSKLKKVVVYRGPCGRRLRNMEELHKYLRQTKNTLNVENFDFDCLIHCLAEYVIESSIVQKSDISDGLEHMIIPSINYYDNSMPPECIYSTKRIPTEGVHLNLDPEFLVGCDCVDDCSDKSKCSCWRLTLAGARFGNPNTPPENVGYSYKRLPEPVPTGIYECNSKCKCAKNCLNRVVQQPLQMKLQVFKTSNRGWGLRCLNDVPKGSFICIYAGHLLTEQNANEGGANSGDEYFAELDYIEVVERLKEGYESDVQENESEEEDVDDPVVENDSDEDFRTSASYSKDASINTRLRARASSKKSSEAEDDPEKRKTANVDDDEDEDASRYQERQVLNFEANTSLDNEETTNTKYRSIRRYFGKNEYCYVMDAKKTGNIGRYFNHSCSPNLFVQNVFVDTHDLRFPWVAFFALSHIRAGTELTWNYNYEVGIVPGKVLYCECGAPNCRGRLL